MLKQKAWKTVSSTDTVPSYYKTYIKKLERGIVNSICAISRCYDRVSAGGRIHDRHEALGGHPIHPELLIRKPEDFDSDEYERYSQLAASNSSAPLSDSQGTDLDSSQPFAAAA